MVFSNSFSKMLAELRSDCNVCNALYNHKSDLHTEELDYITMRGTMISYLPAGREHLTNDDGRWRREGRQEGKPARIVRKIIPGWVWDDYSLNDSKLEKFSNLVSAYVMANGDGENGDSEKVSLWVCNGNFITYYYNEDNYSEYAGGNLTGSCMKDKDCNYFEIYRKNTDKVQMAVALDANHKVLGRALIWHTDNLGVCMDTIYAKDDVRPMFIKFAKENGIRYKSNQSCHHHDFDMLGDDRVHGSYARVSLANWDFSEYPYMDTMMYLDEDGMLSNREPDGPYRELRNTDGSYDDHNNYVEDVITGDDICEDDATYIDYRYEGSWYSGYTMCETHYVQSVNSQVCTDHCLYVNGDFYMKDSDDIVYVHQTGDYYHIDDVRYDEDGDAIPADDAVQTVDGNWVWLDDAVETSEGWMLECDCEQIDGEWVSKGNNQNQEA